MAAPKGLEFSRSPCRFCGDVVSPWVTEHWANLGATRDLQNKPRFVRRTARWWNMIYQSREHVSTAPESNVCFTPLQLTPGIEHGGLRLECGCSAMETHFLKRRTNSSCAEVASRGSLELWSECCNRGQKIVTSFSTLPVLWTCVAYHFEAELLLLLFVSTSQ